MSTRRGSSTQVAESTNFDNTTNGFSSTNVQGAIEEIGASASPGFSFGRSGNLGPSTVWLSCESVPSNKAGRYVYINNAEIVRVFVSNEIMSTFTLEILYHEGDEVGLTSLGTVTVVSARGGDFVVSWNVPTSNQLSVRLISGTAKNVVAGLELKGNS